MAQLETKFLPCVKGNQMFMHNQIKLAVGIGVLCVVGISGPGTAGAAVLVEFDAAAAGVGVEPDDLGWTLSGEPMVNNGAFLLQDNTSNDPTTESGAYLSANVPAGTMSKTSGQYGIEVTARPLTDIPHLGFSHFGNMQVQWSDDAGNFTLSFDLDSDDGGTITTAPAPWHDTDLSAGGVKLRGNGQAQVIGGIDWSIPHTIFVGYDSVLELFNFYLDGTFRISVPWGAVNRGGNFAQDAVYFGDGTTGQGVDIAGEWYSVRIHDVNTPTIAGIIGDLDGDGFVGIADLNIVLGNWNQNVTPGVYLSGDPSNDGFVGIEDLNTVLGNWNAGTPPNDGSAVPEPASILLVLTGGLAVACRRVAR